MENTEYRLNQLEEWRKEASEIMSQLKINNAVNTEIVKDLKDGQKWATRFSIMSFAGIVITIAINVFKG